MTVSDGKAYVTGLPSLKKRSLSRQRRSEGLARLFVSLHSSRSQGAMNCTPGTERAVKAGRRPPAGEPLTIRSDELHIMEVWLRSDSQVVGS